MNIEVDDSWHSYPKVWNLGHAQLSGAFLGDVIVEEKVDGSQFSFGRFGDRVRTRSRGREFDPSAADSLFSGAVETVLGLAPTLHDGWTYRGEVLQKPKHNTLAYDRVPPGYIIIFDINDGQESYLPYGAKLDEAERIGLMTVPLLHHGKLSSAENVLAFLDRVSVLGGQKIEGVVVKDYLTMTSMGKAAMGKHVSEAFKETNNADFRVRNPHGKDVLDVLGAAYRCEARWNKAIEHLRERDALDGSPKDIGPLLRELQDDIDTECSSAIKDELWKWARKHILRKASAGFPEWYKERLLQSQFTETGE